MSKRSLTTQLLLLFLAALFLIVACRREQEEETPTPAATEVVESAEETGAEEPEATTPPTDEEPAATGAPEEAEPTEPAPVAVEPVDSADIDWSPQVVLSDPQPGARVPLDTTITLRFDQPMDQDSVEAAFSLSPAVTGDFVWNEPDTLVFTPQAELERDQLYQVRLAETAAGANGQTLELPVEIDLQTIGNFNVTQTVPEDGTRNVETDAAVTVVFDQPVVPLVSSGEQADLPQPLAIEPPVEGRGEWVSTSIYRFIPDPPLAGATNYRVSVDTNLTSVAGGVLEAPVVSWQFTTMSPRVVQITPVDEEAANIIPTSTLTVTFNMPMERASTEAAVSLSGGGSSAALDYEWQEDDTVLVLQSQEPLALETAYNLVVAVSARSASGQASLDEEAAVNFMTVPFPAVRTTIPADGQLAGQYEIDTGVLIEFVSPMDLDTLEDQIIIDPPPDGNVSYFGYWYPFDGQYLFNLGFAMELNTEYTVTIPGTAADPYGNTLGEDYTWSFTTPPLEPLVSFNLAADISQISTAFPTTIQVIHRNVSGFEVALYDLGLNLTTLNNPYDPNTFGGELLRQISLTVDEGLDEIGVTDVDLTEGGGTLPTGIYYVKTEAAELSEDTRFWQNQDVILVVADTNIVVKEMYGEVRVWVTDLTTGQPVSGRTLTLYDRSGQQIGTTTSDDNGFARFDYQPAQGYLEGVNVVSNEAGQAGFGIASSYWTGNFNLFQLVPNINTGSEDPVFVYLYTDRPIYRPGDTVYYKGIVREANFGRYTLPVSDTLEVNLFPLFFFGEGGSQEETFEVTVDDDGIFFGEYEIPQEARLGNYQLSVDTPNGQSFRPFLIAEYRNPEFLVTVTPETADALRGEAVDVVVDVTLFSGGSAANLNVRWNIYEDALRPDGELSPLYSFGDQGDFFYEDTGPFGGFGGGTFGNSLTGGDGLTDQNGQLTITLPAALLEEADEGGRKVTVEVTASDIANFPVTANASVDFHAADVYVGVAAQEYIATAGIETGVDLVTVDWDGEIVPNQDVEVVFYARDWEANRNADFGIYYTEWTPVDTEVGRESITTGEDGEASVSFTPEMGGTHLAVATVTDDGGRTQTSSTIIWAVDDAFAGWRTDPTQRTMELVPDKDSYAPGETAHVLVQSPFAEPVQAWLTIERGVVIEERVVVVEGSTVLDIPIPADYAPNVFVTVTAVKPANPDSTENQFADIRLGIAELVVPPDELRLDVTLTPQEESYGPGDTAVYDIQVTNSGGSGIQAELSLALVDLAVLTLQADNAPVIVEAFYARQPYRSQIGSGLFITGEGLEVEIPLGGGGKGGGGGDEALPSVGLEEEDDVRRRFPDTAYWEAKLVTDENGQVTVEIPLPDTLTIWRLSSKAVTTDSLVGQSFVDIQATLPLLLRPVTPRFFTVGDVIEIGTVVNNNTGAAIEATVSLEATGLILQGDAEQIVDVPANGQMLVRWPVMVEDVELADLTFRVSGGEFSDATKPPLGVGPDNMIPVYRFDAADTVATAGTLAEAGRRVEAVILPENVDDRRGSVEATLSPSLAAAMLDALTAVNAETVPPDCGHAAVDRLLPNVATARAIEELELGRAELLAELESLITADIAQIQRLIRTDGGWGWCFSGESDPWLSAYSLLALAKAQAAGYEVDQDVPAPATAYPAPGDDQPDPSQVAQNVPERATLYVEQQLADPDDLTDAYEVNRQAFFLYVLAEAGQFVNGDADALVDEHQALLDPYAKALLVLVYELNDVQGDVEQSLLTDLNNSAIVSATGVHWEDESADIRNLSSNIRGTAIVVNALTLAQPDAANLPPAVRWLMVARSAERWPTIHESAWSIVTLTDWLAVSGELEADYPYQLNVNLQSRAEGAFAADSSDEALTTSAEVSIPINELVRDGTNFFDFQRGEGGGRLYYTLHLNSAIAASTVGPVSDRGIAVTRQYFDAECDPETEECAPIESIEAGQQVRVELSIVAANDLLYAVVEDPIPSGAEAVDPGLATTEADLGGDVIRDEENNRSGYWGWWYFDNIEYRDEKVVFTSSFLPAGTYQYTYYLQTNIPGEFQVMPSLAYQEFFPEVFGRSGGSLFAITEE